MDDAFGAEVAGIFLEALVVDVHALGVGEHDRVPAAEVGIVEVLEGIVADICERADAFHTGLHHREGRFLGLVGVEKSRGYDVLGVEEARDLQGGELVELADGASVGDDAEQVAAAAQLFEDGAGVVVDGDVRQLAAVDAELRVDADGDAGSSGEVHGALEGLRGVGHHLVVELFGAHAAGGGEAACDDAVAAGAIVALLVERVVQVKDESLIAHNRVSFYSCAKLLKKRETTKRGNEE